MYAERADELVEEVVYGAWKTCFFHEVSRVALRNRVDKGCKFPSNEVAPNQLHDMGVSEAMKAVYFLNGTTEWPLCVTSHHLPDKHYTSTSDFVDSGRK